ncbi:hypothetical protein BDY21DRAFT_369572 [Lineolata rhizophorae]|uniref:Uncharacterized protein n=1 Tax=Lineolata rhizophorae TaxID=578093 RepID=A0A6A6P9C5_9PEZI|nr:hypothetical protein BDY21DRAFT_369572 [Lineolata rhizophorae]
MRPHSVDYASLASSTVDDASRSPPPQRNSTTHLRLADLRFRLPSLVFSPLTLAPHSYTSNSAASLGPSAYAGAPDQPPHEEGTFCTSDEHHRDRTLDEPQCNRAQDGAASPKAVSSFLVLTPPGSQSDPAISIIESYHRSSPSSSQGANGGHIQTSFNVVGHQGGDIASNQQSDSGRARGDGARATSQEKGRSLPTSSATSAGHPKPTAFLWESSDSSATPVYTPDESDSTCSSKRSLEEEDERPDEKPNMAATLGRALKKTDDIGAIISAVIRERSALLPECVAAVLDSEFEELVDKVRTHLRTVTADRRGIIMSQLEAMTSSDRR